MINDENIKRVIEKHHLTPFDPAAHPRVTTTKVINELYDKGMPVERIAKELEVGQNTVLIFIGRAHNEKKETP